MFLIFVGKIIPPMNCFKNERTSLPINLNIPEIRMFFIGIFMYIWSAKLCKDNCIAIWLGNNRYINVVLIRYTTSQQGDRRDWSRWIEAVQTQSWRKKKLQVC